MGLSWRKTDRRHTVSDWADSSNTCWQAIAVILPDTANVNECDLIWFTICFSNSQTNQVTLVFCGSPSKIPFWTCLHVQHVIELRQVPQSEYWPYQQKSDIIFEMLPNYILEKFSSRKKKIHFLCQCIQHTVPHTRCGMWYRNNFSVTQCYLA